MKCFAVFILAIIIGSNHVCSQTVSNVLIFEEPVFDFGEILEQNGVVSHTFVFENKGKTPILINDVVSGCGCTNHEYSKEPIRPGQKGAITIGYNPYYRPGFFSKEIIIFSNNGKHISRIWIKGTVIPTIHPVENDYPYSFGSGLYLNLKVLAFGRIEQGKSKQIRLRYANDTEKPMLLNFVIDGNDRNLTLINPGKLASKERGEIMVSYTRPVGQFGEVLVYVYAVVNGTKLSEPLQVKVAGID